MLSTNCKLVIFLLPMLTFSIMFFHDISHSPFGKDAEEGGREKASLPYSNCCSEPFFCAAVHLNCTCSLVVQLLNGAN